jgi:hypothetical protein
MFRVMFCERGLKIEMKFKLNNKKPEKFKCSSLLDAYDLTKSKNHYD